jgi:hypothetical protein
MKMIRKAAALILIVTILTGCDAWEEDRKIIVDYRYTSEHYEKETEYRKEYSWLAEDYIQVPYEVDRYYPEKYELLWEITYQDGHTERRWKDCTRFEYDNARTELGDIK